MAAVQRLASEVFSGGQQEVLDFLLLGLGLAIHHTSQTRHCTQPVLAEQIKSVASG